MNQSWHIWQKLASRYIENMHFKVKFVDITVFVGPQASPDICLHQWINKCWNLIKNIKVLHLNMMKKCILIQFLFLEQCSYDNINANQRDITWKHTTWWCRSPYFKKISISKTWCCSFVYKIQTNLGWQLTELQLS